MDYNEQEHVQQQQFQIYDEVGVKQMAFLQKVYITFLLSLVAAGIGSMVGLRPTFLKFVALHPIMFFIITIVALIAAYSFRREPGINLIALFIFTFLSGMSLSPLIAVYLAIGKAVLIKEALLLTVITFGGLSAYVFITKKDFSFLGGFLFMGLFALIGFGFVLMFVGGSSATYTLYSSIGALLFCGFILYDTSKLLQEWESNDYIGFAIQLYLDFLNLFLFILRILSGSRD